MGPFHGRKKSWVTRFLWFNIDSPHWIIVIRASTIPQLIINHQGFFKLLKSWHSKQKRTRCSSRSSPMTLRLLASSARLRFGILMDTVGIPAIRMVFNYCLSIPVFFGGEIADKLLIRSVFPVKLWLRGFCAMVVCPTCCVHWDAVLWLWAGNANQNLGSLWSSNILPWKI